MPVNISEPASQDPADALPDDASMNAAGEQFSDSLRDPEVKKKAYEDVKKLAETIRNIRAGFLQVAHDLAGFDAAQFKDTGGRVITLGPQWRPYIKQFDDTLQSSLEQATSAATMMRSINMVLGDVTSGDAADLKTELQQFMRRLSQKEKETLEVKNKFQQLSDDVSLFSDKIDAALAAAAAPLQAAMQKAQGELTALQTNLNNLNAKIQNLGSALIRAVATGAVATGIAIFTFCPIVMVFALGALMSAMATRIELDNAMNERSACLDAIGNKQREIQVLNQRIEELKRYKAKFEGTKAIVADISSQIAVITNIWQTINLDMHAMSEDLDANVGPDSLITRFFLRKLRVSKQIYKHLIFLLDTYIEQVRVADNSAGRT